MQGITLYPGGISYADVAQISARAEDAGFAGVYFVELRGNNDALAAAQAAATATCQITVGTNIVNAYMRHPSQLAAQAIAVDEISGGRLVLGIGASHRRRVEALGMVWRSPVDLLTDTTRILRAASNSDPLGRCVECHDRGSRSGVGWVDDVSRHGSQRRRSVRPVSRERA